MFIGLQTSMFGNKYNYISKLQVPTKEKDGLCFCHPLCISSWSNIILYLVSAKTTPTTQLLVSLDMFLGFALVVGSSVLFTFNLLLIINSCFPWLGLSFKCKAVNRDLAVRFSRRTSRQDFLLLLPVSSFQLPTLLPVCLGISQMRNGKKRKRKGANCLGMRHKICIWAIWFMPLQLAWSRIFIQAHHSLQWAATCPVAHFPPPRYSRYPPPGINFKFRFQLPLLFVAFVYL